MSPAAPTSRSAYDEQVISGRSQTQRERILDCLRSWGTPLTRRQIAEITRIPINAVCGRVDALLKSELIRVAYEDKDHGSMAPLSQFLEAVRPAPEQRRFEWPR